MSTNPTAPIRIGDPAPDFSLPDQHNHTISLSSLRGRPVVLYFYPRDHTRICTAEACAFRDQMHEFESLNAVILGISSDSVASHAEFARNNGIRFSLLADVGGVVRGLYGVPRTLGLLPGRVTYVIDASGVVRAVFSSQFQASKHVQEAREALARLAQA